MPQSFDYRKMNRHLSEVHVPHLLRQKYSKKIYIYTYISDSALIQFYLHLDFHQTSHWHEITYIISPLQSYFAAFTAAAALRNENKHFDHI